ncbi:MAG: hypothetical protein ACK4F9_01995 [Brevinematia bacterium]
MFYIKIILVILVIILSHNYSYGTSIFFKNHNAVFGKRDRFTLILRTELYEKYSINMTNYNILDISIAGSYNPNNFVEVSFRIPYLKILQANDNGILSDITLSSKFLIAKEIFSIFDDFLLQDAIVINVSLATGVKKEDSYRNINFEKGLYFPLSSGYTDIELGNVVSLIGTFFGLSFYSSFLSISSKTEPLLAFNTENDNFLLGTTLELFIIYYKNLTMKLFFESTLYVPISDKSKYLNTWFNGLGMWYKLFERIIISFGYYKNFLDPVDLEKYHSSAISFYIGIRF